MKIIIIPIWAVILTIVRFILETLFTLWYFKPKWFKPYKWDWCDGDMSPYTSDFPYDQSFKTYYHYIWGYEK